MAPAQPLGPGPVDRGLAVARGLDHGRQRQGRRGQQLRVAAAVVDQLARRVGDADEAGVGEHRRRAVAHLVVELAADHEHEVGLGHGGGAHGAHDRRVIGRDQAAALLGIEIDRTGPVEQAHQLGAGLPGAAPGHHQRALGRPDRVDRGRDRRRHRAAACAAASGASSRRARAAAARACAARRSGSRDRPGRARPCRPWRAPRASSSSRITCSATRSGAGEVA